MRLMSTIAGAYLSQLDFLSSIFFYLILFFSLLFRSFSNWFRLKKSPFSELSWQSGFVRLILLIMSTNLCHHLYRFLQVVNFSFFTVILHFAFWLPCSSIIYISVTHLQPFGHPINDKVARRTLYFKLLCAFHSTSI